MKIVKNRGELDLGGIKLPCFVLNDGTRVLTGSEMLRALGFDPGKIGGSLERSINNKWLKSGFYEKVNLILSRIKSEKIYFKTGIGGFADNAIGYEATLLIDIADLYIDAFNANLLDETKIIHAKSAEILIRSVAKVGIIALIDEATGYQYEREKFALITILKTLVSDEILEYQSQFQLSFYKEIFRLWGIPFTEKYINRKPSFVGHLTNRYIYSNLPVGIIVLNELKKRTPRNDKGGYKYRLHQSLTKDIGREALKKVLYSVEALASVSKDKIEFDRLINERYGQKTIPFPDFDLLSSENIKVEYTDFDESLIKALNHNPNDTKKGG